MLIGDNTVALLTQVKEKTNSQKGITGQHDTNKHRKMNLVLGQSKLQS